MDAACSAIDPVSRWCDGIKEKLRAAQKEGRTLGDVSEGESHKLSGIVHRPVSLKFERSRFSTFFVANTGFYRRRKEIIEEWISIWQLC